jgi:pimeloyl-ACP methyl ester carboxylesterase
MSKSLTLILALAALGAARAAMAQTTTPAPGAPVAAPAPAPNDYTDPKTWLCRPGRHDACTTNQDATIVRADGSTTVETFKADPMAQIDCFYVYPTVSHDPHGNAAMVETSAETSVVDQQLARFGSQCRLYAPLYRQVTLTALAGMMTGKPIPADRALAYHDVVDAWNEYLAHDNHGRGVVLIGHSQGSGVLTQLIKNEIDGKPVQKQIISAILMGTSLPVPKGQDVGGAFKTVPLCHSASQTGCAIAFASFRAEAPPPANSRFGHAPEGMQAACVNPAALGGGSGPLKSYLAATGNAFGASESTPPWTSNGAQITTPFVSPPGLLTAECQDNEHGSYLAITVHAQPSDVRVHQIVGDVVFNGQVLPDWGLHLIDANLTMGNLVEIVAAERKAYLAKASH